MNNCADSVRRSTFADQAKSGGAIPASALHFNTWQKEDAEWLVLNYHYSRRIPKAVRFIGTLHEPGGLFGDCGRAVAACFFSSPPTRWNEPVLELTRLVRADRKVPLSFLVSMCCRHLKRDGADLLVSFADTTQGHEGYIYQACGWRYHGKNKPAMDGVVVNGKFIPGRTANARWGTRSPEKLASIGVDAQPHYDMGKHLYWKPLGTRGKRKANRLKLQSINYPKSNSQGYNT